MKGIPVFTGMTKVRGNDVVFLGMTGVSGMVRGNKDDEIGESKMEIEKLLERLYRLMIIISLGVFSISMVYMTTTLRKQKIEKENNKISISEHSVLETQNILILRRYHDEQKLLLKEILYELRKHQGSQDIQPSRQIQCL